MTVFLPILLAAAAAAPNVVLITVDTLRADRLGMYGYRHDTSPNLDALAEQALVFEDMVCEIPLTGPSFCSMYTSRYPRATGTTRNGLPLPENIPTVAEQFREAGYQTVCVQSNWTLKGKLSGLDRGFEIYDDDFHKKRWGIMKSERGAKEVTRIALELLAERDTARPLFAWIHYSDPHAPYKRHRKFEVAKVPSKFRDEAGNVRAKYDTEVAFTDHHIARVLEALPTENTVVVFLADHGESLGEHDYVGHGRRVYQATMRIPFFIRAKGVAAGRSAAPARGIDVAPTLLGLAGLAPVDGMDGVDLLKAPLLRDRVRVVETYGGAVPGLPGARAVMANAGPQRQAVFVDGWKLILGRNDAELFRLSDDPMEENDLSKEEPERVAKMRRLIEDWDEAVARESVDDAVLSEDDIEALKGLGYLE